MHYHGTPITPASVLEELAGRNFCVSFAEPRQVATVHRIGQSVMLDNGAFTFWGKNVSPDWNAYMDWAEDWLNFATTWAVIPDVIDGSEEENDALLVSWFQRRLPKAPRSGICTNHSGACGVLLTATSASASAVQASTPRSAPMPGTAASRMRSTSWTEAASGGFTCCAG